MKRSISVRLESWPSIIPFRISNHVWHDFPCVVCEIEQDGVIGRGEALGVYYFEETPESMADQLQGISAEISAGADREQLLELLPAGGALPITHRRAARRGRRTGRAQSRCRQ